MSTDTLANLRKGDHGPDVRAWQLTLCRAGHHVACDGSFGPVTDAATRTLQHEAGLVVDGVVGPKTRAAAAKRIPDGILRGIDVSRWQARIDWRKVAAENAVDFAYIKATEGASMVDASFVANLDGARKAGLRVGAYHYMTYLSTPIEQAVRFLATYQHAAGDLPPALDLETAAKGELHDAIVARALQWLRLVEHGTKVRPVLYTYSSFITQLRGPQAAQLAAYPLWVAHYDVTAPTIPGIWKDWALWQTTGKGRITGIVGDVDLNVMRAGVV